MAKWGERLKTLTQTIISKNNEMTEITKLNIEISNLEQKRKMLLSQVGEYALENNLLNKDMEAYDLKTEIMTLESKIEDNREKVREIRRIQICPVCGIEVARSIEFCPKCGIEIKRGNTINEKN